MNNWSPEEAMQVPEDLEMALSLRTDMHDGALADDIPRHILDIIGDGLSDSNWRT
jgi:hypothetical protein